MENTNSIFGPEIYQDESVRFKFTRAATDEFTKQGLSEKDMATRNRWREKAETTVARYDKSYEKNEGRWKDEKEQQLLEHYKLQLDGPSRSGSRVLKTGPQIRREAEKFVESRYHAAREKFIQKVRARDVRFTRQALGIPERQPDRSAPEYRLELHRR